MAGEMDNATEYDAIIPEVWRPGCMEARYGASVIHKRVLSADTDLAQLGDKVWLPVEPAMTIGDITKTDGTLANQALTFTTPYVTVDKWRGAKVTLVEMAIRQSVVDAIKTLAPSFGKALAYDIDDYIASLHASIATNYVGDAQTAFNGDLLLAAMQTLININVPVNIADDISLILHTSCWSAMKNIDKFNFAHYTGLTMGGQLKYEVQAPYGVPTLFTPAIDNSSGYQNFLIHK